MMTHDVMDYVFMWGRGGPGGWWEACSRATNGCRGGPVMGQIGAKGGGGSLFTSAFLLTWRKHD